MRIEIFTAFRAERPRTSRASIKVCFWWLQRQTFMTSEADWMGKHFRSMDDRKFSKQNFASFQIPRCDHVASQFIISLHLQKCFHFTRITRSFEQMLGLELEFFIHSHVSRAEHQFLFQALSNKSFGLSIKNFIYFVWFAVIFMAVSPIGNLAVFRAVKHETATWTLLFRFTFAHFAICHNFTQS